uniref:Lens fiber major intrinsic protein-like n=1 Tax=Crassostrea virginica TaxID=6565 RepID=A0A8B8EWT5_CRAVI|nr:lens fiber major intrinsic protein-like [Crassostrea virginica]XP_022344459.1 lens fiber major intrinsic protein-like [Crassostrea virginica]
MKPKEYFEVVKGEVRERHFWKSVRCEFLGTLLYVLFGCAATVTWNPDGHDPFKTPRVSASFGLVEFLLVSSLGHASGCQLNPALTVSLLCTRYITLFRTVCYLSVQLIAGLISSAILYGLVPEYSRHHLAVNEIGLGVTHAQAFGIEFLGTFIFVFSYFSSLRRKNEKLVPKALPCGVSITIAHLFAIEATGCGINPARSLPPAIFHSAWSNHWIFWIGPILGGIVGAFTFEYTRDCSIQLRNPQDRTSNQLVYSLQSKEDVASSLSLNTEVPAEQNEIIDEL